MWLLKGPWKTFLNCIWNDFLNSFAGHQRINLPLATVLMPAGKAKEMTQRASRQIPDEIQAKLLTKSLKNWNQRIFMDPNPGFLLPKEDSLPINTQWSFETVLEDVPAGFRTLGWGRFQAFGQPVDSAGSHLWVVAWAALQSTVGTRVVGGGFLAPHAALWPGSSGVIKERNIQNQISLKTLTLQHPKIIPFHYCPVHHKERG